ncbi:MAG: tetratricopeptide repeat protein [Gemmatimonadota bacterium]
MAAAAAALVVFGAAVAGFLLVVRGDRSLADGIDLFRAGRYSTAAEAFERVLERDPERVTALLYLGRIERRRQAYADAAERLRTAARLAPDDPDVHRELGHLFLDLGRAESAVARFELALEVEPDAAANWIGLVRALRAARDPHAEAVLRRAPPEVRAVLASGE